MSQLTTIDPKIKTMTSRAYLPRRGDTITHEVTK